MYEADPAAVGWITATVPGNIQADLEAARRIGPYWFESTDPLLANPVLATWGTPVRGPRYGTAEMFARCDFTVRGGDPRFVEVARKDWWYRKDFEVPPAFEGRRVKLVFDGVDHECEVWLNGRRIGGHAGMYRQMAYDVAEALRPGKVNRLAVRIARMPPVLEPDIGMPKQIKAYRHELSEIKSPSYGLDWGLGVFAMGIWRDVRLEASGPARIEYVQVQTKLEQPYTNAAVVVRLEIDSLKAVPVKGRFRIDGQGAAITAEVAAELKAGVNLIEAKISLENPELWWPAGQGEQPLYQLHSELVDANGALLHTRSTRLGVRDLQWVAVEGSEDADAETRSQLVVNGRKVRFQGTNLIPVDMLPGRQHDKADWLLRMVHAAGMNFIRIWAGSPLREEWYDLADQLGIMVQQEMPATNSGEKWPVDYSAYTAALERTATSLIKQLRNHPCVVEWTGGNEMGWPSRTSGVQNQRGNSILPMLRSLFSDLNFARDDRVFRDRDPDLNWSHGPYKGRLGSTYKTFNQPSLSIRRGEFGAPGPAHLETWYRDIPPSSQWPLRDEDPVLVAKNVFWGHIGQSWLQLKIISELGGVSDLPSMIKAGHWHSAEQLRYMLDAMRRRGSRMSGFTNWVFNEPWRNGAGNTMVDYDGRPLMNYFLAKQALTPVALSLRYDSLFYQAGEEPDIELFLTSDAPQTATGLRWTWLVRDRRGAVLGTANGVASIAPLEVQSLGKISVPLSPQTARGPLFVELRLENAAGECLGERLHLFSQWVPGPFAGLVEDLGKDADADDNDPNANPKVGGRPVRRTAVEASVKAFYEEGGQEVLSLQVRNTGTMTALFCEPQPLISYRTDLLIDNNYCFIPPGESRLITIRADLNSECGLTLAQTGWRISSWNADDVMVMPSGNVLLSVGRRDQMCREFVGYLPEDKAKGIKKTTFEGTHPDASQLFYLADKKNPVRFEFPINEAQVKRGARLRIHTADQSKDVPALVQVTVNGTSFEQALPLGIGLQQTDPSHLAFPSTLTFDIPSGLLQSGKNVMDVRMKNDGWFTWDALELATKEIRMLDEAYGWFEARLPQMIKDCRRTMKDGTAAYPPQIGGGYEAFWLRDYAYILEGAAALIPREELLVAAKLFVNAVSPEGAGVDCVKFEGTPIYKPGYGSMGENPVADGGPFTVAVIYLTWRQTGERALLEPAVLDVLVKTMDFVVRDNEHGLVLIDPAKAWDRCAYGFTDSIRKKGLCLFESLLYVEASRRLSEVLAAAERKADSERFSKEARRVADAINAIFWDDQTGLYRAATVQCKEHDIWGSAFAVWLGVADEARARRIAGVFKANHAGLTQKGGLRHTLPGVYWENGCGPDTYQNGGFWGTPVGWYAYTLDKVEPKLAEQLFIDLVNDYAARGVSEWVFGDHVALPNGYMSSASLPLQGIRRINLERK